QFLDHRYGGYIESIPCCGLEGSNSALAQDHVVIATRQNVLGREQPLLDGGGNAPLEQHGFASVPKLAKQRVILHVARTHLEHVVVLPNQLDLADVHHFGDELQVVRVGSTP